MREEVMSDKRTDEEKLNEAIEEYSDDSFWEKVKNYAKDAGEAVLSPSLKMYYTAQDPDTPIWAKTTIYGALLIYFSY